jgi:hypothetical protein
LNVPWRRDAAAWYATVLNANGTTTYLTVERVPAGTSWDWAVWNDGDAPEQTLRGVEPSDAAARSKAEACLD